MALLLVEGCSRLFRDGHFSDIAVVNQWPDRFPRIRNKKERARVWELLSQCGLFGSGWDSLSGPAWATNSSAIIFTSCLHAAHRPTQGASLGSSLGPSLSTRPVLDTHTALRLPFQALAPTWAFILCLLSPMMLDLSATVSIHRPLPRRSWPVCL